MDEPDDPVDALVKVRDVGESRSDPESRFIGSEVRVATYAYLHGSNATARDEALGGLMYLRLLTETAIRLRWLAGPYGDEEPGGDRQIDPTDSKRRIQRLRKRDLRLQVGAYRALREVEEANNLPATWDDLIDRLVEAEAALGVDEAPQDLKAMARPFDTGQMLYAGFRLSSSMVHPGLMLGSGTLVERSVIEGSSLNAAMMIAGYGARLLKALA
jgi:hypothetical protein